MQIEEKTQKFEVQHIQTINNNNESAVDKVTLRQLRLKNKQTEHAIQAVQSRIYYMKNKEQKTMKKVINVKRKLTSLDLVKKNSKQNKNQYSEERRRMEEQQQRKLEFNKLVKDHLRYNKKIVMTLMNHKVNEEAKAFRQKKQHLQSVGNIQKTNLIQDNLQKVNKIRIDHIEAQQKRKMYFLDKLQSFKKIKERKLQEELKQRQKQQNIIHDLQDREKQLLERLSISEKFKIKCQEQYEEAKNKYHSFYQASRELSKNRIVRNFSRDSSVEQGSKADIFIS